MLKMLIFKPQGRSARVDGTRPRSLTLRERARKYGRVTNEQHISSRRDVLITGPHSAGKSYWLERLEGRSIEVWGKRAIVRLNAIDPLSKWADHPELPAFAAAQGLRWPSMAAHARVDLLASYIKAQKAVVLLDDCHKLTGRKLAVATRCAEAAHIVVSATMAEQSTSITLRLLLERRNPTRIDLASEAAYDSTAVLMWFVILISLGAGAWQVAAVLTGLKFLSGGRGANKQS